MDSAAGRSWLLVAAVALIAVTTRASGCAAPVPADPLDGYDLTAFLGAVGEDLLVPAYAAFADAAIALQEDLGDWRIALEAGGDGEAERAVAQGGWRAAMTLWQEAEVFQIGPAADAGSALGGEDVRDSIYSWPTVNPCLIDQGLVDGRYAASDFLSTALVNAYGLDALEWLLFGPPTDTLCPSQVIDPGTWDAIGDLALRRARYGAVVATAVVAEAVALRDSWSGNGGFAEQLAAPSGEGLWTTGREALQEVFASSFYLELVLKDRKLARPLGILDCSSDVCPEDLETPWSGEALRSAAANLVQFRRFVAGPADGPGLADLLSYVGSAEVGEALLDATERTLLALEPLLEDDPAEVLATSPEQLEAVHDALADITDLLKADIAVLLALTVPAESAGDAD
jgi:predicted lipoprotein